MILNCINWSSFGSIMLYKATHEQTWHEFNRMDKVLEIIIVLYLMMFMKHSDGCSEHN